MKLPVTEIKVVDTGTTRYPSGKCPETNLHINNSVLVCQKCHAKMELKYVCPNCDCATNTK